MTLKRNADQSLETLARGLAIIETFTDNAPTLSLTEVAGRVGLSKVTALRFLCKLESLRYLERDPLSKRYRPGLRMLRLGFGVLDGMELVDVAQPFLRALSAETGEMSELSARDGAHVITLDVTKAICYISIESHVGSRQPAYCTALGKAQLIDLSTGELFSLLGAGPYPKAGPRAATRLDEVLVDLELVRKRGFAVNDEELTSGLQAVAAPIRGRDGTIVAGIGIPILRGPESTSRLTEVLGPMVLDYSRRISSALGARLPPVMSSQPGSGVCI